MGDQRTADDLEQLLELVLREWCISGKDGRADAGGQTFTAEALLYMAERGRFRVVGRFPTVVGYWAKRNLG